MILTRLIFLLALLAPAAAFAQPTINAAELTGGIPPIPYKGMLYSDEGTLTYTCVYDAHLACSFVESTLRKKADMATWEKQMPELEKMRPMLNKGLDRECAPDYLKGTLAVIKGEKQAETHEEKEVAYTVRELDAAERAKHAETVTKLCETRDFIPGMREAFEREARSCVVASNPFTLHFFAPSPDQPVWESKGGRDEECRIPLPARFETTWHKDGYHTDWTLTLTGSGAEPNSALPKRCERARSDRVFKTRYDFKTRHKCEYLTFEPG